MVGSLGPTLVRFIQFYPFLLQLSIVSLLPLQSLESRPLVGLGIFAGGGQFGVDLLLEEVLLLEEHLLRLAQLLDGLARGRTFIALLGAEHLAKDGTHDEGGSLLDGVQD